MSNTPAARLSSRRIELIPSSDADAADIIALHRDERVTRHLLDGIPDGPRKVEIYLRWAAELHATGIGPWTARHRSDGRFLGMYTLTPVDGSISCLEFGGRLARAAWHGDLAVEGAASLIEHAFAGLGTASLVSIHHPENRTAPIALARLGFTAPCATTMFGQLAISVSLSATAWQSRVAPQRRQALSLDRHQSSP